MGNPVIWFEIHGQDPSRLHDFYRSGLSAGRSTRTTR